MEAFILFASTDDVPTTLPDPIPDFLFTRGKVDGDDLIGTDVFGRVGIGPANSSLSINLISSRQFILVRLCCRCCWWW